MDHLGVLAGCFGYAVLGAIVPFLNTELIAVTVPAATHTPPLLVAVVLGIGQTLGKTPYWLAGRGADRWSRLRRERPKSSRRRRRPLPSFLARPVAWLRRVSEAVMTWGRRGGLRMTAVSLASGAVGIPPFTLWPVAAGAIDRRWWRFAVPAMIGRIGLYTVFALAPGLVLGTR